MDMDLEFDSDMDITDNREMSVTYEGPKNTNSHVTTTATTTKQSDDKLSLPTGNIPSFGRSDSPKESKSFRDRTHNNRDEIGPSYPPPSRPESAGVYDLSKILESAQRQLVEKETILSNISTLADQVSHVQKWQIDALKTEYDSGIEIGVRSSSTQIDSYALDVKIPSSRLAPLNPSFWSFVVDIYSEHSDRIEHLWKGEQPNPFSSNDESIVRRVITNLPNQFSISLNSVGPLWTSIPPLRVRIMLNASNLLEYLKSSALKSVQAVYLLQKCQLHSALVYSGRLLPCDLIRFETHTIKEFKTFRQKFHQKLSERTPGPSSSSSSSFEGDHSSAGSDDDDTITSKSGHDNESHFITWSLKTIQSFLAARPRRLTQTNDYISERLLSLIIKNQIPREAFHTTSKNDGTHKQFITTLLGHYYGEVIRLRIECPSSSCRQSVCINIDCDSRSLAAQMRSSIVERLMGVLEPHSKNLFLPGGLEETQLGELEYLKEEIQKMSDGEGSSDVYCKFRQIISDNLPYI